MILLHFFHNVDIDQIVINHMSDHPRDSHNNYSEPSPKVLPLVKLHKNNINEIVGCYPGMAYQLNLADN